MSNKPEDNTEIQEINISERLKEKIEDTKNILRNMHDETLKTARELYIECANIAIEDGISTELIKDLLKEHFKDFIPKSTLVDYSHKVLGLPLKSIRTNPSISTKTKLYNNHTNIQQHEINTDIPKEQDGRLTEDELNKMMDSDAKAMEDMDRQSKELEKGGIAHVPQQSYNALEFQRDNLIEENKKLNEQLNLVTNRDRELEQRIEELETQERKQRQSIIELANNEIEVSDNIQTFKTIYSIYPSSNSKVVKWDYEFTIDPIKKIITDSKRVIN